MAKTKTKTKFCNACKEELSVDDFGVKKDGKYGRRPQCKTCTANASKRRREKAGLVEKKPKPPKPEDIRFKLSYVRKVAIRRAKRFVITSSLNNTPVDQEAWAALKTYAEERDAVILVMPVRYKNPTSRIDGKIIDEGAWWPEEVMPYMVDELVELHPEFWLMGHVRVQATAANPLTSMESLSRGASAAFAHPQLMMKMVPTPQNKLPKILYTTQSISQANYSDTKAGILADFHHGIGALVVEKDKGRFHVRPLVVDDDHGFYDIDRYYTAEGSEETTGALALVTGDEHAVFSDPDCMDATYYNDDSMVAVMKPAKLVRHDVFDGYSISHHHKHETITKLAKHASGHHLVEDELLLTASHINRTTPPGTHNLIVSSNHHDHLLQWMKRGDILDTEPWNFHCWRELWNLLSPTIIMGNGGAESGNPFELWAKKQLLASAEFLESDSDYTIGGVCVSMHGHNGANGARGTLNQFAKIGVRSVIGHSHTPGLKHGCCQVGTSSRLKLEYTKGLSSWMHCHCVIHPNGKRQLLLVIDGHWRLK